MNTKTAPCCRAQVSELQSSLIETRDGRDLTTVLRRLMAVPGGCKDKKTGVVMLGPEITGGQDGLMAVTGSGM